MAKSKIKEVETKVDRLGFRIKILYVLIVLNIGTAILLRFV